MRPGEGEHWFKVWLVVIDGQVYVRLGSRAAERVESNTTAPVLGVEVAGQRFDRVRGVPAPEYADRVAKAMAEKYTSDIFVHLFSHPLTLRLVPEDLTRPPHPSRWRGLSARAVRHLYEVDLVAAGDAMLGAEAARAPRARSVTACRRRALVC